MAAGEVRRTPNPHAHAPWTRAALSIAERGALRVGHGAGACVLMSDLRLRIGTERDHAFVLDLGRRTSPTSASAFRQAPREAIEGSYEQLVEFVTARSHLLLIAETHLDGPLGFVLMLDDIPDEVTALPQGFIAYMAVRPEMRRRGVAARLLHAAEDAARARGLPTLALMVTEDNLAARELYAQAGFATERRLLCKRL